MNRFTKAHRLVKSIRQGKQITRFTKMNRFAKVNRIVRMLMFWYLSSLGSIDLKTNQGHHIYDALWLRKVSNS
jgi:hypothetical protein